MKKLSAADAKTKAELFEYIVKEYQISLKQVESWWVTKNQFFYDKTPEKMFEVIADRRRLNLFLGSFRPREKTGIGFMDEPELLESVLKPHADPRANVLNTTSPLEDDQLSLL